MKKIILISCFLMLLTGCNKAKDPEKTSSDQISIENKNAQFQCDQLTADMHKITIANKLEDLEKINSRLKACVKGSDNQQQLEWVNDSTQMYDRFLYDASQHTEDQNLALQDYGYSLASEDENQKPSNKENIKGDITLFKKLNPHDQYLIKNQGRAYIDFQYIGEGIYRYRRNPQYLVDLVAPSLPQDQREFMERMAKDNQEIFFNDGAITVSWKEVIERALFWESYIKKYPEGHFTEDAESLFNSYKYFIFLGTANTPVSDDFNGVQSIDKDALAEIKKLSQHKSTSLSEPAKAFLKFIDMPTQKRNQEIKVEAVDAAGEVKHEYEITLDQLHQYLNLSSPWVEHDTAKDCYTDAICLDYN